MVSEEILCTCTCVHHIVLLISFCSVHNLLASCCLFLLSSLSPVQFSEAEATKEAVIVKLGHLDKERMKLLNEQVSEDVTGQRERKKAAWPSEK